MVGADAAEAWLGTPLLPASQLLRVLRGGLLLPDPTAVSVRDRTEEDRSEQKRTDEHRGEQKRAEEDRGEQRGAEGAQRSTDEGRGAQTRAEENRRLQKSSVRVPDLPQSEQDEIEAAITRCQPITVGVRQRAIFDLARRLRGIRSLQSVDPVGLRSIVEAWHRRALPVIGTKPFEDSWVDFLRAFPKVRSPLIDVVVEVASGLDELPDPSICERYESPQCRRLIKLVVAFAGKHADASGVFFMSCRSVAAAIGIGVTQAANYLFLLCEEALLERVDLQLGPRAAHRYRLGPILTTCAGDKQ